MPREPVRRRPGGRWGQRREGALPIMASLSAGSLLFVGGHMKLPTITIGAELEGRASRRVGEPSHIHSVSACTLASHVLWRLATWLFLYGKVYSSEVWLPCTA